MEQKDINSVEFQDKSGRSETSEASRTRLVTLNWQGNRNTDSSSEVIKLPVPYELPPQPYTAEGSPFLNFFLFRSHISFFLFLFISSADVPWSWDRRYNKKDVYGQVWPRHVQLYAAQDS